MYSSNDMLIVNTTSDLIGYSFEKSNKFMFPKRLYKSNTEEIIEQFSGNIFQDQESGVNDLVIKHLNDNYLKIYDCNTHKLRRRIEISSENNEKIIHNSLEDSVFRKSLGSTGKLLWLNERRQTINIEEKALRGLNNNFTISEYDEDSYQSGNLLRLKGVKDRSLDQVLLQKKCILFNI